eukprot:10445705-Alexandrium_andersonii.AAC.1
MLKALQPLRSIRSWSFFVGAWCLGWPVGFASGVGRGAFGEDPEREIPWDSGMSSACGRSGSWVWKG